MGHLSLHPAISAIVDQVAQAFQDDSILSEHDRNLVFVCGGGEEGCVRYQFMDYAASHLPDYRFFLAEKAQRDYVSNPESDFLNLAIFEEILGTLSDCTIIFPESPGSFSELGYFAAHDKIRRNLLVVGDSRYQGRDSFLMLGPIELIDSKSNYRPSLQIPYNDCLNSFHLIGERLSSRLNGKRRQPFPYKAFLDLRPRDRLFALTEIISIFGPIDVAHIISIMRKIFKNCPRKIAVIYVSFLVGAGYVERCGEFNDCFRVPVNGRLFLTFKHEAKLAEIRLKMADIHQAILGSERVSTEELAA